MSRILVVHGTGGPHRHDASVRLEWITSIRDGMALAGADVACADDDIEVLNLDGHPASPTAPGTRPAAVEAWIEDIARRCLSIGFFDDVPPPADRHDPRSVASALAWTRYFVGLPVEEIHHTLRVLHAYLSGGADPLVRARLTDDVRVVVGHSLGAVPAIHATDTSTRAMSPADAHRVLLTIGTPLGLAPEGRTGGRWLNLVDRYDTLALATGPAARRDDIRIDCDPRVRAVRPYVASPEFGHALAEALRRSATASGSRRCPQTDIDLATVPRPAV